MLENKPDQLRVMNAGGVILLGVDECRCLRNVSLVWGWKEEDAR